MKSPYSRAVAMIAMSAVMLGVASSATGNVSKAECTATGVRVHLAGWNPGLVSSVPVKVALKDGTITTSTAVSLVGSGTADVDVPAQYGDNLPVDVTASWGPGNSISNTVSATARCIAPAPAPQNMVTPTVPATAPEPPRPSTTPRPKPPRTPRRDCAWLRGKGAGVNTLKRYGCYRAPAKCVVGQRRVVSRYGGTITVVCIRTRVPSVTG